MAHQATNIPWKVLASNLKWSQARHPGHGDLHLRFKPQQGKELHYFVEAFIGNVHDHARTALEKPLNRYEVPHPDDIILDDATVRKISPTIHRWRTQEAQRPVGGGWLFQPSTYPSRGGLCRHIGDEECECPIPYEERKAASFSRKYQPNGCYRFFEKNGKAFFNQELVKTLLLYGEMDTILRVCTIPDVGLKEWWQVAQCYDTNYDAGWDQICYRAVMPYIALNLIYCFPETWDDASGRTDEKDYRLMRIYQYMLRECSHLGATSKVTAHPHRRFFGIEDGQFTSAAGRDLCGKMSLEIFLLCNTSSQSKLASSTIPQVEQILRSKGLPTELILDVIEMAGYEVEGRLKVAHDPFNPENRDELANYLNYCWKLLVRCEMMANAIGMEIPWMEVIYEAFIGLFECGTPQRKWHHVNWDEYPYIYTFL